MNQNSTFNLVDDEIIELHYTENITAENQSKFLAQIKDFVDDNPNLHRGIELLVDMSKVENFDEGARKVTEHFVKGVHIFHSAVYGASEEIKNVRNDIYVEAGKNYLNHYFANREDALGWMMAEKEIDHPISGDTRESILYESPKGYIEIIYPENVDIENQNDLCDKIESYAAENKGKDILFLVDSSKVKTFSYAAQMRTVKSIKNVDVKKVANYGSGESMRIVRDEYYNISGRMVEVEYFNSRDEAIAWLLKK